ncbi:MAG: radical SAM family heme chaperone HemW [Anaerolineae bacterium]|nr:radical SAM family heme chaperone HemW [Anaerolineae bacterium]
MSILNYYMKLATIPQLVANALCDRSCMSVHELPYSVYLHIPFCKIKCTYCAFNTYVNLDDLIEPFVRALINEIAIIGAGRPGHRVDTIYLGGGTPSVLMPEQLHRIISAIRKHFNVSPDAEISMESNPSDLDVAYMTAVRQVGINRLSIGMQSAHLPELDLFARRHDHPTVVRAVDAARRGGFDNLNLDLIYGIPNQTLEMWRESLNAMLSLTPEHISLYALGIEDGTPLKNWVETGKLPAPDDDLAADMYELASDMLDAAGYEQYEISNWAKPGHECRHNLQYWRNLPYPGLGPGAHGYAAGVRYHTILSPQRYIKALERIDTSLEFPRTPAVDHAVVVDRSAEIAETLMMGLRLTQEGISRETFRQRFGVDVLEHFPELAGRFAAHELVTVDEHMVRITRRGRLLSNMIFRELV